MRGANGRRAAILAAGLAALLAGCGEAKGPAAPAGGTGSAAGGGTGAGPAPAAAEPLPAGLRLDAAPAGAQGVAALKKTAKEGDAVVLRARVGGAKVPFTEGRAVMIVADTEGVTSCADMEMGEDACKTPWDYCCTSRDVLVANTATVRVAGADGRPVKADLRTLKGLEPLKVVVVRGVVGPRPDPAVLVVDATGIFIE